MKKIPIAFSFDDNWLMPAGICISSLLSHANPDTYYDIFILHDDNAKYPTSGYLEHLHKQHSNFKITYRSVGNPFSTAFEVRGVTISTYYRLLIPDIVPEYSSIMYHDIDVIFRSDLSKIYLETDLKDYYLAGVIAADPDTEATFTYRSKIGADSMNYINAGNLILNSAKMRKHGIVEKFKSRVFNNYLYQDQDIINIICKGNILFLPPSFSGTIDMYKLAAHKIQDRRYTTNELEDLLVNGNIHYNGPKPWKEYCPNFDIWWEYYRSSIFFDPKFYFDFYRSKFDFLDKLPLLKRIKLVLRFFKTGGKIK